MSKKLMLTAVLAATILPFQAFAFDDKDVIDYRQHIMKSLDEQVAAVGMIVATQVPDDNLVQHLNAVAMSARIALKSFEAKVPGGESKPEVWAQWADFSAKMNDLAVRTAKLAEDGKTGGVRVVTEQLAVAFTCKGCHDTYREKK
jgi:cytochrome c556